jgi:CrcB protein
MDRAVQKRHEAVVPWGTVLVNLSGSFLLGVLTGVGMPSEVRLLVGTGFCGAFTTYSTFAYEVLMLTERGRGVHAVATLATSILGGLGAALIGFTVGSLV